MEGQAGAAGEGQVEAAGGGQAVDYSPHSPLYLAGLSLGRAMAGRICKGMVSQVGQDWQG